MARQTRRVGQPWTLLLIAACSIGAAASGSAARTLRVVDDDSQGLITFWSDSPWPTIWAIRPDGSNPRRLLRTRQNAKRPRLSPDRRWVAFDGAPPGTRPLHDFDIQLVRRDGSGRRTLAHSNQWEIDAQWAPDGSRLSFARMPPGAEWQRAWVWVVRPNGSGLQRLARGQTARWSPDGGLIALDSPTDESEADLFVINADGSSRRRLTATGDLEFPAAWSPDGKKILFTRFEGPRSDVFVVNADGTDEARLTHSGQDIAAAWSPDGSMILFTSKRTGGSRLYLMDSSGARQRTLPRGRFRAYEPDWR